eukprot:9707489-Ditylum_brightwellii.AAC.1
MALKVEDLKTPCKRLSGKKKPDAEVVAVEESNRSLRQFRRKRPNDQIQLSRKTRCVRVVLHVQKDVVIDLKQCTGQKDTFEKNMRDRLKKYKKAFRELMMHQRRKKVNEMATEIMCCFWVREDLDKVSMKESIKKNIGVVSDVMTFLGAVQNRIEQLSQVKMNMMICRDTEAREDDTDGSVSELDDDTMKSAFGILSEATGHGYERIRKRLELVSDVKFSSKYILDKEQPPIKRMIITPLKSPHDESAGFGNNDINCTTEGETYNLILSCGKMGSD